MMRLTILGLNELYVKKLKRMQNITTLMQPQFEDIDIPAKKLWKITNTNQNVDEGWKCLNSAEKKTVRDADNCTKPSTPILLAVPIRRKSNNAKRLAPSDAMLDPPSKRTMKKLIGGTKEEQRDDIDLNAVYSILVNVKSFRSFGGLIVILYPSPLAMNAVMRDEKGGWLSMKKVPFK